MAAAGRVYIIKPGLTGYSPPVKPGVYPSSIFAISPQKRAQLSCAVLCCAVLCCAVLCCQERSSVPHGCQASSFGLHNIKMLCPVKSMSTLYMIIVHFASKNWHNPGQYCDRQRGALCHLAAMPFPGPLRKTSLECHAFLARQLGPPMSRLRRNRSPLLRPRRRGTVFPLDKTSPRGIMIIQKGAVDLTVGPKTF